MYDPRRWDSQRRPRINKRLRCHLLGGDWAWTDVHFHAGFKFNNTVITIIIVVITSLGLLFPFAHSMDPILENQVLCSVFAGVYNEFLIKGKGADIDIMIQNVFMYLDSIVCNVLLLGVRGDLSSAFTSSALSSIANPLVIVLILNNAILGIVTSLFLQVR